MTTTEKDLLAITGRTALVTGAGQVGRAIAGTLAAHGARRVVITDLYEEPLAHAARIIEEAGAEPLTVVADITDPAAIAELRGAAEAAGDPIQIVVNNAGMPPGYFEAGGGVKSFVDTEPLRDWEPVIRLNLYGVMYVTHAFLPAMISSGWGRVVTVVSDSSRTGDAKLAPYAAAKAGSAGFMRSIASEVGRFGITANCISLGTLWRDETSVPSEEYLRKFARSYPVGKPGYPEDVAALVQFLASDASKWITGQVYPLNGGYSYAL